MSPLKIRKNPAPPRIHDIELREGSWFVILEDGSEHELPELGGAVVPAMIEAQAEAFTKRLLTKYEPFKHTKTLREESIHDPETLAGTKWTLRLYANKGAYVWLLGSDTPSGEIIAAGTLYESLHGDVWQVGESAIINRFRDHKLYPRIITALRKLVDRPIANGYPITKPAFKVWLKIGAYVPGKGYFRTNPRRDWILSAEAHWWIGQIACGLAPRRLRSRVPSMR
jgi:hypothetical protein